MKGVLGVLILTFSFGAVSQRPIIYVPEGKPYPPPGYRYGPDEQLHKVNFFRNARLQSPDIIPNSYGTGQTDDIWIPSAQFRPKDSTTTFATNGSFLLYRTGGTVPYFLTEFRLPKGSRLLYLYLYYSDTDPTFNVSMWFCESYIQSTTGYYVGTCPYNVSSSGAQGNSYIGMSINLTLKYREDKDFDGIDDPVIHYIVVSLESTTASTSFYGVRAWWYRQVSPAPTTATFSDVPLTHPAFQYVEALAASGIVVGCGNGKYCPTQYVTRGQMAIYISKALGLFWSPYYP